MGKEAKLNPVAQAAQGPATVLDCRGRVLQVGDGILLTDPQVKEFRVVEISPLLDPKFPPNSMRVTLICQVLYLSQRGRVNPEFARLRTAEEAGPLQIRVDDPPEGDAQA